LLGALFSLVVRIISSRKLAGATGRTVGDAYAANTVGAIAGSFASGFILVPWLGLLGSLRLCVALNFVVAAAAFSASSARRPSEKRARPKRINVSATVGLAASVLLIIVVVLGEPPWDPEVMSSAVYRYAPSL